MSAVTHLDTNENRLVPSSPHILISPDGSTGTFFLLMVDLSAPVGASSQGKELQLEN